MNSYSCARYYDSSPGRFVSEDPAGFEAGVNFFDYVNNNPLNLTDPSGLSWRSNWTFFWDWVLSRPGGGARNYRPYGPGTLESREMSHSPGAEKLRDLFYRNKCRTVRNGAYGTFEAYWDTIANPFTADWSNTSAQVGGFGGAKVLNNGDGTITFIIPNTAGTHSFFLHAVPDINSPTGPMHNIDQLFWWTEAIDSKRGCGCK